MKSSIIVSTLAVAFLAFAAPVTAQPISATGYDAAADPSPMLAGALARARAGGRKVLLIAGGDWCPWCMALEKFVAANPDVRAAIDRTFVPLEVYVGEKNSNTAFFAKLPKAIGYPHFWVLDADGKVLASVDTSPLENGKAGYDRQRFLDFVAKWQRN